jgi:DNA-binding LacI/PurR family transcriptional regulator
MRDSKNGTRRPTIKDIARESGYSKTSVSFAFNNPSRISEKTRDQILKTADRLGYIPNPMARNFSLQRHLSIGFLLPQMVQYSLKNPYTLEVIAGIGGVCEKMGYTLTIIPPLHKSLALAVRNAAVDGLITLGSQIDSDIITVMQTRLLPFVMIDGPSDEKTSSIYIAEEEAAYTQMKIALDYGHRKIAIIGLASATFAIDEVSESVSAKRMQGYHRALREQGLDFTNVTTMVSECSLEDGRQAGRSILALPSLPTCVVTMSDIVAIGCITAFREAGISVPDQISVVGFDNIEEASTITPALTTIDQPATEKGRMGAKVLFSMIDGTEEEPVHHLIEHRLIVRDSLAPR